MHLVTLPLHASCQGGRRKGKYPRTGGAELPEPRVTPLSSVYRGRPRRHKGGQGRHAGAEKLQKKGGAGVAGPLAIILLGRGVLDHGGHAALIVLTGEQNMA